MMDAGKMITTSVTRRMRLRDNRSAGYAPSRNYHNHTAKASRDHQQQQQQHCSSNNHNNNNNGSSGCVVKHFPRNLLLNSRNLQRNTRKNQHQRKHDAGIFFGRNKHWNFTREVHDAICERLGHRPREIPGDSLQALFNDMKLYVSDAQVDTMIQCARQGKQVSRRNGAAQYLTFGEVCFIASAIRAMQKPKHLVQLKHQHQQQQQHQPRENKVPDNFEVFLGGSCNPTTWRTDTAIPELQRHGISYYNPQVSSWAPELVAQEYSAKQSASLLLFVVDNQTRCVAGMLEVAFLVASGRCVVLVAYPYREGQCIMDEPITQSEYLDLMHGQTSLLALVKSQGVKVHSSLAPALQCTANILRNGSTNGMTADEQVTHKLRKLREVFDSFDANRLGEINLKSVVEAYQRLTNKTIDIRSLCEYLSTNTRDANHVRISFDQFCVLVAEFSVDDVGGCESFSTSDDWFKKQCPSNNNTQNELSNLKSTNKSKDLSSNSSDNMFDLFLGGSSATTNWRTQCEPLLKDNNITFCNPTSFNATSSIEHSITENVVLQWKKPMDSSRVLLFYITNDTRSLTTMILAAHYIGLDRNVILCIEHLPNNDEDVQIADETLTKQAIKDYNRGRVYLHDLAKRKQVPVFDSITEAVQSAIDKCRE